MNLRAKNLPRKPDNLVSENQGRTKGEGWSTETS